MHRPIEIFFSYAHEDEALMDDVRRQLIVFERNGRILKWHDREIPPGSDWRGQIDDRLNTAQIVLLFISPHFIESRYCYEIEGQAALRRRDSGEAEVIPIILRPCAWQETPFGILQALPHDAVPVSRWPDRDEACLNVATGVMTAVDRVINGRENPSTQSEVQTYTPRGKETDRKLFESFREVLPSNGSIAFIDKFNMAGFSFERRELDDLYNFLHTWNDADHEFLDAKLEELRTHLLKLVAEYVHLIGLNTFPTDRGFQTVPPEWEDEQPKRFHETVTILHDKAGEVVKAHQQLIRAARKELNG